MLIELFIECVLIEHAAEALPLCLALFLTLALAGSLKSIGIGKCVAGMLDARILYVLRCIPITCAAM